jgi:molybdopterin-containing oxidoreductase family iron-sulfur binding subunit
MRNKLYSRRDFIKIASVAAASGLGLAACTKEAKQEFLQKYYRQMTDEEKKQVITRLEKQYFDKYGVKFDVSTKAAVPNTLWGYGLDLSRCIGCRRCVYGCVKENNQSREHPQLQWIRVIRLKKGSLINLENSEHYYNPQEVPEEGFVYQPVQCQQCENPPCVKVCPVKATWKDPDGIVVVDYNWCIGCRYCMAACPYKGRVFNWAEPTIPKADLVTATHYLGNRPRYKHVVEKCTFCVQRVRQGRYPACVEACPTGTRKFGNLLDPNSEIRYLIDHKPVFRMKEDRHTEPKFFYFFSL